MATLTKEPTVSHPTDNDNSISNIVATTLSIPCLTIGVDLGDRESHDCVMDASGCVVERGHLATTKQAFDRCRR